MNKTQQLDELFIKWENEMAGYRGPFLKDGIINEEQWGKTSPKILFITKEANQSYKPCKGDFRQDWCNKLTDYIFAYRIAEWSFGILNNFPPFEEIYCDKNLKNNTLQKISFMNVKKIGGIGLSSEADIREHFTKNKLYIIEEIEIINPDIIILGLSFDETYHNNLYQDINWITSGYNVKIGKYNNIRFIDFYHPSVRFSPSATYSLLQNVYQSKAFQTL